MKLRLPSTFYNLISYAGAAIAAIASFMFVFLYVLSSLSTIEKAYEGIVIFILIPIFIVAGLLLIPIGMIRQGLLKKKRGEQYKYFFPVLDLNLPQHRNATIIFSIGTLIFLFLSALGSYESYHFTESVTFCGTTCHNVMKPEYTAYQTSPHARVTCAECHVGAGANWYVKSKLSGTYQVYATLTNVYPRPIPTPIKNLRPARETCEECHWPQKVYGKQQRLEIHYLPDEQNSRWEIDMLMNTGGGNPATGQSSGIHWHINPEIQIEYVATDEKRLNIPRVIMFNKKTNEKVVYNSTDAPISESDLAGHETRTMDCIDCHNRPSHIYRDPLDFINMAIAAGEIDSSLPYIKKVAVEASMQQYATTSNAYDSIAIQVRAHYADNFPEIADSHAQAVEKSIGGIQKAFSQNIFPEMKVRWENYADHIGHLNSPGCFRCHDDRHVSETGRAISRDCNLCHSITSQGTREAMEFTTSEKSLEFKHPEDIGDAWKEGSCVDCHATPPL
jgi:nitrate/TMAO reductase-like tetraheme cytochrome c subunit